jgi:hypothetical protein
MSKEQVNQPQPDTTAPTTPTSQFTLVLEDELLERCRRNSSQVLLSLMIRASLLRSPPATELCPLISLTTRQLGRK